MSRKPSQTTIRILRIMKEHPKKSPQQIEQELGIHRKQIWAVRQALRNKGIILPAYEKQQKPLKPGSLSALILQYPELTPRQLAEKISKPEKEHVIASLKSQLRKKGKKLLKRWDVTKLDPKTLEPTIKTRRVMKYIWMHKTESYGQIAKKFGIHPASVSTLARKLGLQPRPGNYGKFSAIDPETGIPLTKNNRIRKALISNPRISLSILAKKEGTTVNRAAAIKKRLKKGSFRFPDLRYKREKGR